MIIDRSIFLILPLFCFFVAATFGWGLFVLWLSRLGKMLPDSLYLIFYAGILGILVQGDLILFAGLIGGLDWPLLSVLFAVGNLLGTIALKMTEYRFADYKQPREKQMFVFFILCAPFILLIFAHSLVPDVSGDAYLYHITVPNYYALEGRIDRVPISFCYNYPLQIEMYYLAAIRIGQEQAGVMMNFAVALLTALGLYLLCRRLDSAETGLWASFLFLSLPLVLRWAPTSLVDLSTAAFLTGTVVAIMEWREEGKGAWLFLAGLSAGGAVAVKLLMGAACFGLFPLAIAIATLAGIKKYGISSLIKNPILYFGGTLLPLVPWMIKNKLLTGNPIFPFFYEVFPTRPDLIPSIQVLSGMHGIPAFRGFMNTFDRAMDIFPLLMWDGNWVLILCMVIVPISFIFSLRYRWLELFWLIEMILLMFILYYGRNAQVRWFQGFYAVLLGGLAISTAIFIRKYSILYRPLLIGGIIIIFLIAGRIYYLRVQETGFLPWMAFSRNMLSPYLEDQARVKEARFVNYHVPSDGKVFLYDREILSMGRWSRRRFYQAGEKWFEIWEQRGADWDRMYRELRSMGITHVAASEGKGKGIFEGFKNRYLVKAASRESITVYELKK